MPGLVFLVAPHNLKARQIQHRTPEGSLGFPLHEFVFCSLSHQQSSFLCGWFWILPKDLQSCLAIQVPKLYLLNCHWKAEGSSKFDASIGELLINWSKAIMVSLSSAFTSLLLVTRAKHLNSASHFALLSLFSFIEGASGLQNRSPWSPNGTPAKVPLVGTLKGSRFWTRSEVSWFAVPSYGI